VTPEAPQPAEVRPRSQAVVVAGASAGGVEALVELMRSLPTDFPHPILVVLHVAPTGTSVLPAILGRACRLPVASAADWERLRPGHVYVAPPDVHVVVDDAHIRLSHAPRENGHRPAVDPTMRTAASAYGDAAIGIVLSGSRDDGTAGLMAIKARGGTAIVQDPDEALYPAMPLSAITHITPDAVLPVAGMAAWIMEHRPVGNGASRGNPEMPPHEPADDLLRVAVDPPTSAVGEGTRYTCPDCGGVLFERHEGDLARFECSVGHVFSIESLSSAQAEALESALWAAVRSLEDRAVLLQRLAARARSRRHGRSADAFEHQAAEARERAATIRDAIQGGAEDRSIAAES